MDWLGQNWIWILAAIAFLALVTRRGFGHHGHGGFGGHGGHGGFGHSGSSHRGQGTNTPGTAIDPVSGNAVRTDQALTSAHGGHIFYFESARTRQQFGAEPDKYAANATATEATAPRLRHRHRC